MTEKQLKEIVDAYSILGANVKKDIPSLQFYIMALEGKLNMAEADKKALEIEADYLVEELAKYAMQKIRPTISSQKEFDELKEQKREDARLVSRLSLIRVKEE